MLTEYALEATPGYRLPSCPTGTRQEAVARRENIRDRSSAEQLGRNDAKWGMWPRLLRRDGTGWEVAE